MNTSYPEQKPGLVIGIAVMTLASGIINLFWGFVASATALGTIIGVVCLPITILPTILGIFEIIYAGKLLSAQPQAVQPSPSIAVFEILTFVMGNIFSMVVGILALIFYNDLTVKDYFARLNGVTITSPASSPSNPPVLAEPASLPPEELPEPKAGRKSSTRKLE
ncbi:MAG: hypothetical protein QY332_18385 [Anaerolineales bacterium]|nr:MAG: hypothetical protein QY332_18385 [Anaerolineales bacterium]